MVVLRSSLELHSHSASSATDPLDLSNEFLSLEQIGRRRLRSARAAEQSAVTATAASVSSGRGGPLGPGLRDCPRPVVRVGLGGGRRGPGDSWWGVGGGRNVAEDK